MAHVIPGISGFPLGVATKLRCTDPVLAERTVNNLVEPRQIRVCGNQHAPDIRISHVTMNLGQLFGVKHGTTVHATTAGPIRSYQIMVPLRGRLIGHTRHGEIRAIPGTALVYSPRDCLDTYWSEECIALVLSVPDEKLRTVAREACPGINTHSMPLKPLMSLWEGGGRSFANALGVICQESIDPCSAFSCGVTTKSLEVTLLLALLLSQHEDAADLKVTTNHNRQYCVERVLDVIDARCTEDIGIVDLVRASGASVRTLQVAFMERFGVGPMTYLKQMRLRRVHDDLLAAQPGSCTVGDSAARWGFYNGSTFARAYYKMFGQLPSQTLAER